MICIVYCCIVGTYGSQCIQDLTAARDGSVPAWTCQIVEEPTWPSPTSSLLNWELMLHFEGWQMLCSAVYPLRRLPWSNE